MDLVFGGVSWTLGIQRPYSHGTSPLFAGSRFWVNRIRRAANGPEGDASRPSKTATGCGIVAAVVRIRVTRPRAGVPFGV